jgi:hypothetical protein
MIVLDFTIHDGKVMAVEAISEPEQVAALDLAVLEESKAAPD